MIPRRVSGFNLPGAPAGAGLQRRKALVGTEGTCVLVLEAKASSSTIPPVRSLLVFGYPDIFAAADDVVRTGEIRADRTRGAR